MACTGGRTRRSCTAVQLSLLAALALVMLLCSTAVSANASDSPCDPFRNAVYPYWSQCFNPATYQEQFQLRAVRSTSGGDMLAPEWDPSNSTYYLRLAEDAATYRLSYLTRELRPFVRQTDDVIFTNVETGRSLAWREEGDESFLVEVDSPSPSFQFLRASDVPLPCPRIAWAKCEAYFLVSFSTSEGLTPYEEEGAVYFKKASSDLVPFVLKRVSSASMVEATRPSADTSDRIRMATSAV